MFHFSIWNTPMSNAVESQKVADEKKGWKGLLIAAILSVLFLGIFYLAMANEPDYMPSQQQKNASQQHAFKSAPTMSSHTSAEQSHSIENHEHVMNDAASSAQAH